MTELQDELDGHEATLARMTIKQPFLSRNEIVYWLESQKEALVEDPSDREVLNSALLNHCYVYPDKLIIRMNYQDPLAQGELRKNQNEEKETKKATFEIKDGTFPQDVVRLSSQWLPGIDLKRTIMFYDLCLYVYLVSEIMPK